MSWVKLDDQMMTHPKILAAGPEAAWLFVCSLMYSSNQLTDGFVPTVAVPVLTTIRHPNAAVQVLVRVGLWERAEGGYRIHDYLDYQPSAEKVRLTRRSDRNRKTGAFRPESRPREPSKISHPPAGIQPSRTRSRSRSPESTPDGELPGGEATAAGAAPPHRANTNGHVSGKATAADLERLLQAFDDLGLDRPAMTGFESKDAVELLRHFEPGVIARCWQDVASGEWGDEYSRRELSFSFLAKKNRVGNWAREREKQRQTDEELVGHIVVEKV